MSDPGNGWVPAKRFGVAVVTSLTARRRKQRRSLAGAAEDSARHRNSVIP
jgi:hypothetical protein